MKQNSDASHLAFCEGMLRGLHDWGLNNNHEVVDRVCKIVIPEIERIRGVLRERSK